MNTVDQQRLERIEQKLDTLLQCMGMAKARKDTVNTEEITQLATLFQQDRAAGLRALKEQNAKRKKERGKQYLSAK